MRLFGTSGIRGLLDQSLVYLTLKVGLAVGKVYGNVIVGSDTRTSSDVMKHALISGLLAAGSRGEDAGLLFPVKLLARHSHLPIPFFSTFYSLNYVSGMSGNA